MKITFDISMYHHNQTDLINVEMTNVPLRFNDKNPNGLTFGYLKKNQLYCYIIVSC